MNGQGRALIFFWIIISTWRARGVVGGNEGVKRRRWRGGGNAVNIFSIRSKFIFRGVINNRLYFLVRNILNANVKNVWNDHSVTRLTTYIWCMNYVFGRAVGMLKVLVGTWFKDILYPKRIRRCVFKRQIQNFIKLWRVPTFDDVHLIYELRVW